VPSRHVWSVQKGSARLLLVLRVCSKDSVWVVCPEVWTLAKPYVYLFITVDVVNAYAATSVRQKERNYECDI
jgi:hypothetical protein